MALIELRDLGFGYPGHDKKTIEGIDLDIEDGEFVLICGPSGCGKTTLIKQLIPAITPYGTRYGSVRFMGRVIEEYDELTLAGDIGYVGQNPESQIITDKVWHEIAFGMESLGLSQAVMERRMAEICEFFGMQSWLNRDVDTLSGGEMQMVHLASVMVMEPKVLLLDEPVAQLDPLSTHNFLDMLRRINDELGTTIVIVEHHLEEVYGMADKVVAMTDSKIDIVGVPREAAAMMKCISYLPSSVRIARDVGGDTGIDTADVPLTVSEGQRWLEKIMIGKDAKIDGIHYDKVNEMADAGVEDGKEVLALKNIAFAYSPDKDVLKDCNLEVLEGEIFALLGGNGTGKSTLLHILCQTLKASYGTVKIFGSKVRDVKSAPLGYEGMVYLPQEPMALFTEITVKDELIEAMEGLSISLEDKENRIVDIIERLELQGFEKYHPYDLSSGQMQLLALGKLLLLKPRLILMDEPTKGLDYDRKIKYGQIISSLTNDKTTILMVSHDIEFCARYATRCGLMHDGRIVAKSSARDFFTGNRFFTTAANRIARRYMPDAILPEEVAYCIRQVL